MAIMRTAKLASILPYNTPGQGILTDDKKGVPLPLPCLACAGNSSIDLLVGLGDVLNDILGAVMNLFHLGFLLMHQFRDFLVQLTKFGHIPFDLPDGGGAFQSGASRIIGLAGTSTGDLQSQY